MNGILLAADDWLGILIPFVLVTLWGLRRFFGEEFQNPPRRPGQPIANPARRHRNPKQDLEQFLEELEVKEANLEQRAQRTNPSGSRRQSNLGKQSRRQEPAKNPPAESSHSAEVRSRHLKSKLKGRHAETLHSQLEGRHIETLVGHESIVDEELQVTPGEAIPVLPPPVSDPDLASIFEDKDRLLRAFMLTQVMGPPPGLQD